MSYLWLSLCSHSQSERCLWPRRTSVSLQLLHGNFFVTLPIVSKYTVWYKTVLSKALTRAIALMNHEPSYQNQAEIDTINSGIMSDKFVELFGYCFKAGVDEQSYRKLR